VSGQLHVTVSTPPEEESPMPKHGFTPWPLNSTIKLSVTMVGPQNRFAPYAHDKSVYLVVRQPEGFRSFHQSPIKARLPPISSYDRRSAGSVFRYQAIIWGPRPIFLSTDIIFRYLRFILVRGALSDEKTDL
jgi:hypothetical protein